MGYRQKRTYYNITFESSSDLAGLELRIRSMSTGQLMDLTEAGARLQGKTSGKVVDPEDLAAMDLMFDSFADALDSWNLEEEDTGAPVPADMAGVRAQEATFVMRLIDEWMRAAGGVPDPLAGGSTSGGTFPEASIPMEALSTSP
jgi:hypothetical protein